MKSSQVWDFLSKDRMVILVLLIIMAIGIGLRFHDLGEESLWNDELESWRQSNYPSVSEVITEGVQPDTHPPAFQVILYGVERWLGSSEAHLRLPSALSGSLSILILFLLARRFFDSGTALIASFFLAVMWAPISYSQEARNYSLLILLSLLASYAWMVLADRLAKKEPIGIGLLIVYALSGAAAAYTHYFGLLLVILQGVYLLFLSLIKRHAVGSIVAGGAGILLLYSPWIPSLIEQSTHTARVSWIKPPTLTALPAFFSFAFNRMEWLGIAGIGLTLPLIWSFTRRLIRSDKPIVESLGSPAFLAIYWLGAPFMVSVIVSLLWTPMYTQRNLLIGLPAVYILVAAGIRRLPVAKFLQTALVIGIGGAALYNLIYSMGYYRFDQKEQYREAVEYLVDRYEETSDPFVIGYSRFPDYFGYYLDQFDSEIEIDLIAGEDGDIERLEASLDRADPDRIWFISAHRPPDDGFLQALQQDYSVIDHRSFIMADVRLLKKNAPG